MHDPYVPDFEKYYEFGRKYLHDPDHAAVEWRCHIPKDFTLDPVSAGKIVGDFAAAITAQVREKTHG